MNSEKTPVRTGVTSAGRSGYAAPTASTANRSTSTTRSRGNDTNSAVSSAPISNVKSSSKRLNSSQPVTVSTPAPPPVPSASLADLAESEKLKINRLVEKLFEITAKYEETQNSLKSEREQHQLEINQVYEKINGQLLIIEDKMKLKDETIKSLTSNELALTSLTVIYQRKLKALLDYDLPNYREQIQSLKSTIDILQAEQSSLQMISNNDKQLISRLEKEIIDKSQQITDYQHRLIPSLQESLEQERQKLHKQNETLQELNMKNRFYHTEIKQLQVKIQQLNDAIYHQEITSSTPPRPSHHSHSNSGSRHHTTRHTPSSSKGQRSERRYDNDEDDSDIMMSPPNYQSNSNRKDRNNNRSNRATSSSRSSRSPSPITPNPPSKTKASPALKKDSRKGSEDYSLMFQSVTSDDLERYVRTKHLKDEEEEEDDDDEEEGEDDHSREERGRKGSNGKGKVNYDAIFDTSDQNIGAVNRKREQRHSDDEEEGDDEYDENIRPYQGKGVQRKGDETSKSLDSADWRKRSIMREEEGKRSIQSNGAIISHLPFRKSRSADSSPDNRLRAITMNGERKRRTSDIFFGNDNDDGDDSFTFTANKRAHTMSSKAGITGIAAVEDDSPFHAMNSNGSDKKREKDSLNDTSLFFDNSLNLSTSNLSSLHVSPVTPATALKEGQRRKGKESQEEEDDDDDDENDVGAIYHRLTKSAEKAKREEEQRKEEELVNAFNEQRERARKSQLASEVLAATEKLKSKAATTKTKTEDIEKAMMSVKEVEETNHDNSDDDDDDDSIKKRIAVLSPIDSFNKTFTSSAFTASQRVEKKTMVMSEKELKNKEEDQMTSTVVGSKKYSLLSSYKAEEGKELQKKLSKSNMTSDDRRMRASQEKEEEQENEDEDEPELQKILDSSTNNNNNNNNNSNNNKTKKKKKVVKSSSENAMMEDVTMVHEKAKKTDLKKKTFFHSLDSEVLPYETIMGEKKEKKKTVKSSKSTDSFHDSNKTTAIATPTNTNTPKTGKKTSKLKSKTEDTVETNATSKTMTSKKRMEEGDVGDSSKKTSSSTKKMKSPKTDSIYNASLFDLLEQM